MVPDVEAAARWAQRLARLGPVVRLDSGVAESARASAWAALGEGSARLARRHALGAARPAGVARRWWRWSTSTKPPTSRPARPACTRATCVLERAARERCAVALTAATPSVELWWRASDRRGLDDGAAGARAVADGHHHRHARHSPPRAADAAAGARGARDAGRRAAACSSWSAAWPSALACDECGEIVRCPTCALALAYARSAATLLCRLCATTDAAARYLSALWRPPALAVRLGSRARRARGAPALSQGARGAVGSRGLARRARRGAARGGGRRRRRDRHARGAAALRPVLARSGRLRLARSAPARCPTSAPASACSRSCGRRPSAWARTGSLVIQSQNPEPLRDRRRRPPGSRRVLPARAEVPGRARLSAVSPAGAAHDHAPPPRPRRGGWPTRWRRRCAPRRG